MRKLNELHILNFLSTLLIIIVIALPNSPLRIPLGLPFVLFSPGYALTAALYSRREDLSIAERVALSLGASLAIVSLIGLALNFLPWGVRLMPMLVSLATFTAACSVVAARARRRLQPAERFAIEISPLPEQFRKVSWSQLAVAGGVIAAATVVGWRLHAADSGTGETFTEFYVLNDSGKPAVFPESVEAGQPIRVILGIINREIRRATYTITIRVSGRLQTTLGPLPLGAGERWERKVQTVLPKRGAHQELEFVLFKDASRTPYRRLHLWVNVL